MRMFRQGDVLLVREVGPAPDRLVPIARDRGRIVLAEGEATGHAHAIADLGATHYSDGESRYIDVSAESVDLVHEEHATITLPAGRYWVVRQREFDYRNGDGHRLVTD